MFNSDLNKATMLVVCLFVTSFTLKSAHFEAMDTVKTLGEVSVVRESILIM